MTTGAKSGKKRPGTQGGVKGQSMKVKRRLFKPGQPQDSLNRMFPDMLYNPAIAHTAPRRGEPFTTNFYASGKDSRLSMAHKHQEKQTRLAHKRLSREIAVYENIRVGNK